MKEDNTVGSLWVSIEAHKPRNDLALRVLELLLVSQEQLRRRLSAKLGHRMTKFWNRDESIVYAIRNNG